MSCRKETHILSIYNTSIRSVLLIIPVTSDDALVLVRRLQQKKLISRTKVPQANVNTMPTVSTKLPRELKGVILIL